MNTTITLEYKGEPYTLEYDKASVKALEAQGIDMQNILEKPITNIDALFQFAFLKNHPRISIKTVDEILASCPNKAELLQALISMIDEVASLITGDPSEEDAKNVSWTVKKASKPSLEKNEK